MSTDEPAATAPRDAANWAANRDRLEVTEAARQYGYNINGMRVAGPQQGFGKLWQRTFWVDLGPAVTPQALVADWRAHFGDFWPRMGRFHGAVSGIAPGDVAALEVGLPTGTGPAMATGVLVLYADDTSFTFITPEGHIFAAMITFSGEPGPDGTRAQIRMLVRTSDPLFELGWPFIKRAEGDFWKGTLTNLAASHGIAGAVVTEVTECLDPARLWQNWRNVRHNSGIRSAWHVVTSPFRPSAAS